MPVAKAICVSLLECPSENTLWAWEGDESPLASSQLSCCGVLLPSYHALPSSLLPFPPYSTLLHLDSPTVLHSAHTFPCYTVAQMSVCVHTVGKEKKGEILKVSGISTVPHKAAVVRMKRWKKRFEGKEELRGEGC